MSNIASLCDSCWRKRSPRRKAYRVVDDDPQYCFDCGTIHTSGIYFVPGPLAMIIPEVSPAESAERLKSDLKAAGIPLDVLYSN